MKVITYIFALSLVLSSCNHKENDEKKEINNKASVKGKPMKIPENAVQNLVEFKNMEKFNEDLESHYPGLMDSTMKEPLTKLINLGADDFIEVAKSENPTDVDFQNAIGIGLKRFDMYLDTEDRERVALYFQDMMDIVGLESSNGQLNDFVY